MLIVYLVGNRLDYGLSFSLPVEPTKEPEPELSDFEPMSRQTALAEAEELFVPGAGRAEAEELFREIEGLMLTGPSGKPSWFIASERGMTIEALYSRVIGSEELKAAFVAAVKEKKIAEFLKAQGCEATEAEVTEFLMSLDAEGEIADEELDAVAGGCNDVEFMISVGTLGAYCLGRAIDSATGNGSAKEHWGEGQILCNA